MVVKYIKTVLFVLSVGLGITPLFAQGFEGYYQYPDIHDNTIVLDNLPHETFNGKDAQLEAEIALLKKQIAEEPRPVPEVPAYPDKSFQTNTKD